MQEKSCENCNHYIQHYRKSKARFTKVFWGHCTKKGKPEKQTNLSACKHWEIAETKQFEQKTIHNIFESILERMDEIALLLKTVD